MLYHSPFSDILNNLSSEHLICEEKGETLTAQRLITESTQLAQYLSSQGLKKGDHVLLASESGIDFLILFFALIHLRVKTALIDPHMGRKRYWANVKQFKPEWAFIDSRLLLLQEHPVMRALYLKFSKSAFYIPFSNAYKIFPTGIKLPLVQKTLRIKKKYKKEKSVEFTHTNENDELVLVYTSGTLSEPKAVVHTVDSLFHSIKAIADIFGPSNKGAMVTHLPQFALIGMITGYKTFFWKEKTSVKRKISFIEKNGITTLFAPPSEYLELIKYCEKHKRKFPKSLQHLLFGSAPVLKSFLKQIKTFTNARLTCLYGMTENLVIAHVEGEEKLAYTGKGDLLGKPVKSIDYEISTESELKINSPMLYKRYFHESGRPFFHETGDLVYQNEDGSIAMIGRKKNMIIRKDKNIYPELYEDTISGIKGIQEAVLVGIYNEKNYDEELILIVQGDSSLSESYILNCLKKGEHAIDSDVIPDHIFFMEIPRGGRQQKTDRNKIIELVKHLL